MSSVIDRVALTDIILIFHHISVFWLHGRFEQNQSWTELRITGCLWKTLLWYNHICTATRTACMISIWEQKWIMKPDEALHHHSKLSFSLLQTQAPPLEMLRDHQVWIRCLFSKPTSRRHQHLAHWNVRPTLLLKHGFSFHGSLAQSVVQLQDQVPVTYCHYIRVIKSHSLSCTFCSRTESSNSFTLW